MSGNSSHAVTPEPDSGGRKKATRRLLLTLLGLVCFGGLLFFGGFESFNRITHPDYPWLVGAIFGTGTMVFIFAIRWGGIVNSIVGRRVTDVFTYYMYSLSSLVVGAIVPHSVGTIVSKAAALNKFEDISWKKSGASILLDKMFDGFYMVMFSWPLFFLLIGRATVGQVALISLIEFLLVSLLVVINFSLWIRILHWLVAVAVSMVSRFPFLSKNSQLKDVELLANLKELEVLKKKAILRAYFLTGLGQVMLAVRAWLAAKAIGINIISPLDAFVGIGLVQGSILISVTPGALGFADAAWFIALAGAGVPKEIITVFLVAFRIIENLAIMVCWLPLYLYKIWNSEKKSGKIEKETTKVQQGSCDVE